MTQLSDHLGRSFARLEPIPLGSSKRALHVIWAASPEGSPGEADESLPVFATMLEELRAEGIRHFESRVITEEAGQDAQTSGMRAAWHRTILTRLGFSPATERLEFRIDLETAIANLRPTLSKRRLDWVPVATEPGPLFDRAVDLLRAVAEGDPDTEDESENADPDGFLLARREDDSLALTPESLQIGVMDGTDAAFVAPSVQPKTGWCSHYYLGIAPACRGLGLSTEAMHHGLVTMRTLGGREYHDGTRADNPAALALFRRLGAPLFRRQEEWRVSIGED